MYQEDDLLLNEQDLVCTQKGINALSSNTVLKGRARQYCLLLINKDTLSLQMRRKVGENVDLLSLYKQGYVAFAVSDGTGTGYNHTTFDTSIAEHFNIVTPVIAVQAVTTPSIPDTLDIETDLETNQLVMALQSSNSLSIDDLITDGLIVDTQTAIKVTPALQIMSENFKI